MPTIDEKTYHEMLNSFKEKYPQKVDYIEDCWVWKGPMSGGFPMFSYRGELEYAYRLSYILFNGGIPRTSKGRGTKVRHICTRKRCVNPKHLTLKVGEELTNLREEYIKKWRNRYGA